MLETWLLIDDATGTAVNAVLWDGDEAVWAPGAGHSALRAADQAGAWIGWTLADGAWSPPEG